MVVVAVPVAKVAPAAATAVAVQAAVDEVLAAVRVPVAPVQVRKAD
jgi:hypothetical protein